MSLLCSLRMTRDLAPQTRMNQNVKLNLLYQIARHSKTTSQIQMKQNKPREMRVSTPPNAAKKWESSTYSTRSSVIWRLHNNRASFEDYITNSTYSTRPRVIRRLHNKLNLLYQIVRHLKTTSQIQTIHSSCVLCVHNKLNLLYQVARHLKATSQIQTNQNLIYD